MNKIRTGKIDTKKIHVMEKYKFSEKVEYCKKCVLSNQRPRIAFDENGVCNACLYWERKGQVVDWKTREKELKDLCDRFRRKDGRHDVVVPSSGGKDSAFVAHQLKYKYKMNPLTVTWAPNIYTDIGWSNFQGLIHSGINNILGTPNGLVHRKMTRLCTIEMGEPFQPFIYGQVGFPLQIAVGYDIPLIIDGENGEAEYGGDPSSETKAGFTYEDSDAYWFSGKSPSYGLDHGFLQSDLNFYMPPNRKSLGGKSGETFF